MQACQCLLTGHTCALQAPGETAEARIAGKLRQLRKLVEKAAPGRAAEASAGVHTPPGHMAWFTLVGLPAMVLLPRVLSDDMAQKRSVYQERIRNIQQAVQGGLSQEAVARAGKKPLQVCCNPMLRVGGPTLGRLRPQTVVQERLPLGALFGASRGHWQRAVLPPAQTCCLQSLDPNREACSAGCII